ncbi:MAG: sigma-70 family RNA polymerase sigma factor, partial [Acutalibacteraceae bacterium]|nr:sigma-70 family RNA polymerase sigma factor [Acutalibacteraceae bacterium]
MKDSIIAELAIKAQQGDMQAFGQLYTEFSPLIYSILLEITHDAHEAEDLTQDCFISAIKKIHTLKEPAKAKKWLTAIAANLGKDYLKKKKPALLGEEHEYIFDIQEEENPSLMPEENAVLDERSEEIREIVNSVSEDKRLCLVLFYQHEMSIAEISEELGISESAVKSRLFRAREDIKEEIEKRSKKGMPLFGIAPLPLILFALQKSSQVAATSFAGSAAQTAAFAGVTAASQAGIAAVSTAATATTTASAAVSTASTTATTATGIGAKVAAMSVAQKVVAGVAAATVATGSATVTIVVVKNKIEQ